MKNAAVVVMDMQDFFLKNFPAHIKEKLIAEQGKILRRCIKENIPVVVFEYKAGGKDRGRTTPILEKLIRKVAEEIIIKESNSGFTKTHLDKILRSLKIKNLIIIGVNANACVQDTAIGAMKRGYKVSTAESLIASVSNKEGRLSRKNKTWFKAHTSFYENTADLLIKF
ncbi:MAG: nicotinamidase [Parcubacteria group bacterium]|nr:nicotinamidase [Parcubacteria group bacterium]